MSNQRTKNSALPPDQDDAERVRILIGRGKSKSALDLAKQIHKCAASAASENLLIEAYLSRIHAMLNKQLWEEADALAGLVRDKYPSSRLRLQQIGGMIALRRGRLDDLVRPLLDPDLPRERREAIEETIKRDVVDLQALARCSALPPDHPLRRGATALTAVFEAVTLGPVEDESIALAEISRRSPLASWKSLVRAIAAFYRREDETCRRFLGAVEPGSVPARLVPALEAICSGIPARELPESAARLVDQIDGGGADLVVALARLEKCFHQGNPHNALKQIPITIDFCRRAAPDLVQRLRTRIAVRAAMNDFPDRAVLAAMGGPPRNDAEYSRVFASSMEKYKDPELLPVVILSWENYRHQALHEGRFAVNSPAEAVLFLHMAELLAPYPAALLEKGREIYDEDLAENPPYFKKAALPPAEFSPQALFARSCAIEPHGETLGAWLAWAEKQRDAKVAEEVAEAWHGALPGDVQPLLFLATATQGRGAFQKALGWLAKAERLGALNPEVHRTKMRLLVVAAIRRLRQKKPRLIETDIAALEALPQCREGDRPAFLEALRWTALCLRGSAAEAAAARDRVVARLGDVAAFTLLTTLALRGDLPALASEDLLPAPAASEDERELAGDVARACALGAGLGFIITIPQLWKKRLVKELAGRRDARPLPSGPLYDLATAATYAGGNGQDLAYAATVAGIDGGGDFLPRFLLMRARILPQWDEERRVHAIAAALELARRRRDLTCIDEGISLKPTLSWAGQELLEDRGKSLSSEQVQVVIEKERKERALPTQRRPWPPPRRRQVRDIEYECDCPECRAQRKGTRRGGTARNPSPFDDFDLLEVLKSFAREEEKRKRKAADRKKAPAAKKKEEQDRQKKLFDF